MSGARTSSGRRGEPVIGWKAGKPTGDHLVADGAAGNAVVARPALTPVLGLDLQGVVYEMSGLVRRPTRPRRSWAIP